MSSRKNVIFIGMTQNGKSSLIQQILKYANEDEMARRVAIGQGNIAQTQTCSQYDVDIPLKTHRLRQINGPEHMPEYDGTYVTPGQDFEFDDADEFTFGHDVEDSGELLLLRLIDTPGLSDSGNTKASNSGLRVIDERHKLRILLTLQEVEQVHAICFVVRRDTNYGGDFQDLVRRMVSLLTFSVRSTTWNLQYHIIHTNIDVDDRASDTCQVRQREFDQFGPAGAIHHFVDNTPLVDFPLDVYFSNHSLSTLFKSLATATPVNFSNLYYAKSSEHVCNDQALTNSVERAESRLTAEIEDYREQIAELKKDITRCNSSAALNLKRVDEYKAKIAEIDCDTDSEIDGGREEGWTEKNVAGGGSRLFSFSTTVPIARVEKSHDGDGDWELEHQTSTYYQVTLQPHWLYKAYGKITLFAKKKDKHKAKIESLNSQMTPVKKRWQENVDRATEAASEVSRLENQINDREASIRALSQDLSVIQQSGRSISLAIYQKLVKYFTVDSPLAIAFGYKLNAKVSWTVSPLDKFSRGTSKSRMEREITETKARITEQKTALVVLSIQLSIARGIKDVMSQLKNQPLGVARLQSAIIMLNIWKTKSEKAGVEGLPELVSKLESLEADADRISWPFTANQSGDEDLMKELEEFSDKVEGLEQDLATRNNSIFKELQRAMWEHKAAQVASDYLNMDDGLPVGAFASLTRAAAQGTQEPFLAVYSELKDILELREMALDE
ncbi:uncharacterized protein FTOL_10664 [Fusarium torulosum]|uniref:G domain-containing protein n=1 Tax=Fusarium torulosum TaxID=33205 RepID=A0AAE8MGR9_9HYPO|nr:uncharacterized protein FTOL_10664 [Fusarium torulosum]